MRPPVRSDSRTLQCPKFGNEITVLDRSDHPYRLRLSGIVDYGAGPIFNASSDRRLSVILLEGFSH